METGGQAVSKASEGFEVAVDIGGTFTDVVCSRPGQDIRLIKIPTTRANPSKGVGQAIALLSQRWDIAPEAVRRFVHGTTVATNAVLERRGARIGLLTTEGFRDIIEMGRQYRQDMYDPNIRSGAAAFLVPGALRMGVRERIGPDGTVVTELDESSVRDAVRALQREGAEAIAVSYLFSFVNPAHERRTSEIIAEVAPGIDVSLSSDVDPAFREYERTAATAFDAYVKPVLRRYLENMEGELARARIGAPLQVMQSRGGLTRVATACQRPIRLFLSGPAAGVIGGRSVGLQAGFENLITVDIGGTSCDIALIDRGKPAIRTEGLVDGYPVRVPMVDVNAIGAGGGSIAWIDSGGGLRVGPHSAGSEPGPACYGRGGDEATVTDASVVLGYIDPSFFAGGELRLDPARAHAAIESKVAKPLGMTLQQAALGIHRVLNSQMVEGIRLVSIRRGHDPRRFSLVALGGGGPLHATALAEELGISSVVVPRHPGVLSACGLIAAPTEHEMSAAFHKVLQETSMAEIDAVLADLDRRCGALMAQEKLPAGELRVIHSADVCYLGQSFYLEVPFVRDAGDVLERLYRDFLAMHDRVYGHSVENPVRIANLRTVHTAAADDGAGSAGAYRPAEGKAQKGARAILVADRAAPVQASVWDRAALPAGTRISGPAILEQVDTTTLIAPGWTGEVARDGNLILRRQQESQ